MSGRSRAYCLTLNNYTDDDIKFYNEHLKECEFGVVGEEIGEQGTKHLQVYYRYANPRSFSAMKKLFSRAHIEAAKGNDEQNMEYCKKGGVYECHGVARHNRPGERTDISTIRELVKNGGNITDVLEVATSYQSAKFGLLLIQNSKPPKKPVPRVVWIYGPTGTGKSKKAFEMASDADYWVSGRDLRWFQGYYGQKVAIIDDFRADFCKFHELLRYLDRYPIQVEYKGGASWWVPELIIITSCYHPDVVYRDRTSEDINQLIRRISEIINLEKL